jgi:hypothetical protein
MRSAAKEMILQNQLFFQNPSVLGQSWTFARMLAIGPVSMDFE